MRLSTFTQIVLHDRRVLAAFDAFRGIDIAGRPHPCTRDALDGSQIIPIELEIEEVQEVGQMACMSRPDDDRTDLALLQDIAHGDSRQAGPVLVSYFPQSHQHALEGLPPAEILDDEPVLDQRSILEGGLWLWRPKIPV